MEPLRAGCLAAIAAAGRDDLAVTLTVALEDDCPEPLRPAVLRAAAELVGNAVMHGFYQRLAGRIDVRFARRPDRAFGLDVCDDGWGFDPGAIVEGRGFGLLRALGALSQRFQTEGGGRRLTTVSLAILPPPGVV